MTPVHGRRSRASIPRSCAATVGALLACVVAGSGASAQPAPDEPPSRPLGLEEALEEARRHNTTLRLSGVEERIARSELVRARAALLPRLSVSSGWTRSVDPVAVFGTKLRQGRFGEPDFAPSALNDPAAVDDWETRASAGWDVLDPSRWAARSSADHGARAAGWIERRTAEATDYRTRVLYYESQRGRERVAAAEAAREAAGEVVRQFERRRDEGLLTRADLLQARAEHQAARAEVAAARQAAREAGVELAVHLGWSPDTMPVATEEPAEPGPIPTPAGTAGERADVRAAAERVRAAEAGVSSARLSFLPTLGTFAAWSSHADEAFGGDGTDWTVGVGLRWSVFEGLGRKADLERARAELTAARLEHDRLVREARGEVVSARHGLTAAREAFQAAVAAREAAVAGRDLMRRRFGEGLATPAELLQAEARARRAEARSVDALARYHIARARLRFARAETRQETEQ